MSKYRIDFSGFSYVEAESEEDTLDAYFEDDVIFTESGVDSIIEIDEFAVRID